MSGKSIKDAVQERYGSIARGVESGCGCGPSCCGGDTEALASLDVGYTADDLRAVPQDANLGLGSGNPTAAADLQPGESVLDLGSGAGIDCFLAARAVGPEGSVIGIDMTPDMVSRARRAAAGAYDNVEFRLGEVESLPVADASVDVVISNCVLNLSPDRQRAFDEAFRVLKPGGRLVVSDLLSGTYPPALLDDYPEIVSGCLPVPETDYVDGLERSGFTDVATISERAYPTDKLPLDADALDRIGADPEQLDRLRRYTRSAHSAIVRAFKAP